MSKTPKTRSTLRALEEVATTARKKGAPASFIFAEEEESFDSSGDSSSEDEKIPSRQKTNPKKANATGTAGKQKTGASEDKENEEEQLDLLALLKQGKKDNGAVVANKWIPRADSEPGVCEFLVLLLLLSGSTASSSRIPEFKKSTNSTLQRALEECEFESSALIMGKTPEAKRLVKSLSSFLFEVGRTRNKDACVSAFECCQAASKTAVRPLRQAGTIAAMSLGLGLLNRADQLRKELERATELFTAEEKDCEAKVKNDRSKEKLVGAAQQFFAALQGVPKAVCRKPPANEGEISAEDVQDECIEEVQQKMDDWRSAGKDGSLTDKARQTANECLKIAKELRQCERRAFEGRDSVFFEVAKARFRDVDPQVRATIAEWLGEWSAACPDAMSVSHRSKYLGWMLYDKSGDVRAQALSGLCRLVEAESESKSEITTRLAQFAIRFSGRLRSMLSDPDPRVVLGALQLCRTLKQSELISRESDEELFDEAEDLLMYAPERYDVELPVSETAPWSDVRKEVARLLGVLDPRLADKNDDGEEDDDAMSEEEEGEDEESKPKKRAKVTKKKPTSKKRGKAENPNEVKLRALLDVVMRRLPSSQADFKWAHLEVKLAFDAFLSSDHAFAMDVDSICALLMDETLCGKDKRVAPVLATLLLCAMEKRGPLKTTAARTGRGAKKAKMSEEDAEDSVATKIPDLLVQYRSDPFTLERLVRIVPIIPTFTSQVDKLLRELSSIASEKNLEELLEGASLALSALCEEERAESKAARACLDKLAKTVSLAFTEVVLAGDEMNEDAAAWMARCAALACGTTLASSVIGGDNAMKELFAKVRKVREANLWMVSALKLLLGCSAWHIAEATVNEQLAQKAKSDRNGLADSFRRAFDLFLDAESSSAMNQQIAGLALRVLALFHDARALFWPGHEQWGWTPSNELVDRADAVFMDLVVPMIENDPAAVRMAYEKVLIPMARTALFASPREDAKSAAFVLRFVRAGGSGNTTGEDQASLMKRCAMRLNAEMRKTDVDRWLQAHLETLTLDANHSDALSKTLGPSSDKVAQVIGAAVSGMVCRAIRLAITQKSDTLLNAVSPYLVFCKPGSRGRDRIMKLWEQVAGGLREELDPEFGVAFETKLNKTTKRPRTSNEGGEDSPKEDSAQKKTEKKARASLGAGKKREPKEEFDEDASPFKTARPLDFQPSSKKKTKTTSEEEEVRKLERSVFDRDEEDANVMQAEEEDVFEDKSSSSKKKKKTPKKPTPKETAKKVVEDVEMDEGEDDDEEGEVIGFRPRLRFNKV